MCGERVRPRSDRGSGTGLLAVVAIALSVAAVLVCLVGGYVAAVHRARAAADLSALSGATAFLGGRDACQAAAVSAQSNDATVTSCRLEGTAGSFVLTVECEVVIGWRVPGLPGGVTGAAKAGNAV